MNKKYIVVGVVSLMALLPISADAVTQQARRGLSAKNYRHEKSSKLPIGSMPIVVSTSPANGACDVDPKLDKIVITFDRPMAGGYSFCRGFGTNWNHFPETIGKPSWNDERTQITFKVKLHPGWDYITCLNRKGANNFRDSDGTPIESYPFVFRTSGTAIQMKDIPHVKKIVPANGAKDVSPVLKEIVVTFDRKMRDGCWSVCRAKDGTWDDFPNSEEKVHFDASCTILTIPVDLKPGKTYKLNLNNGEACAFQDENGKSLEDYSYSFTTKSNN